MHDPLSVYNKNLYAYCDNNPTNRFDIDGYMWELALGGGAMVSGYGISMSAMFAAISSAAPVVLAVVATVAVVYNGIQYAKTKIDSVDKETENVKAKKPKKSKKPSKNPEKRWLVMFLIGLDMRATILVSQQLLMLEEF